MKLLRIRCYVHPECKAVMAWHKTMECWILTFMTNKGLANNAKQSLFVFADDNGEPIKARRAMRVQNSSVRVGGWQGISLKTHARTWDAIMYEAWTRVATDNK